MRTTIKSQNQRDYTSPVIVRVKLDNEISLALESEDPAMGPNEASLNGHDMQEYYNNGPLV